MEAPEESDADRISVKAVLLISICKFPKHTHAFGLFSAWRSPTQVPEINIEKAPKFLYKIIKKIY